jgi:DNA-directed RNA polymerase specialized sigma24 family protein
MTHERPEPNDERITHWIHQLKAGDSEAAQRLWERYFERILSLARKKLRGASHRVRDEEDVAQSVMKSLCLGAARGRFPLLSDRDNLWRLLVVITARKVADEIAHQHRQKRGGAQVRGDSAFAGQEAWAADAAGLDAFLHTVPSPDMLVEMEEESQRLLALLGDDSLRAVALLKMEGYTNDEVAHKFGCARRTVARKLELIRKTWLAEVAR